MSEIKYVVILAALFLQLYLCTTESSLHYATETASPCPPDSILNASGICTCKPCEPMACHPGQKPDVVRAGNGLPEMCCSLYKCVQGPAHPVEEYNPINCIIQNVVYLHNQKWTADNCTECTCLDGDIKCFGYFCGQHTMVVKKPCPTNKCHMKCPHGFRLDTNGCELCECRFPPLVYDLIQSKNYTSDDIYLILKIISETQPLHDMNSRTRSENGEMMPCYNGNVILIILLSIVCILIASCGALLWLLRQCRLKNNRMEVCRTQGLNHHYTNVPSYDNNRNDTYKHKGDIVK